MKEIIDSIWNCSASDFNMLLLNYAISVAVIGFLLKWNITRKNKDK